MLQKDSITATKFKKPLLIILALLLATTVVVLVLEMTNTTYIFHKQMVPAIIPVNKQKTSGEQVRPSNSSGNTAKADSQGDKVASSSGGNTSSELTLVQPYGTLVSNHFPGQNGSPIEEQSTCNTTAGATCYIQFTDAASGKTSKLPAQVVGADGSTSWSWNAKILTAGKWQVTAVASLNGQTKSVSDSMKMEVQ